MTDTKRALLFVDLDNTLLGDTAGLEQFIRWHAVRREWLRIVYASGRFYESMRYAIRRWSLPDPDALICGVGTEVRLFDSGLPIAEWRQQIAVDWSVLRVRLALAQFEQLRLQPDDCQSGLKVSYYANQLEPPLLRELHAAVQNWGVSANVIYSSDRDLDVLPNGADKGRAAAFLVRRWKRANYSDVVVSGDSGNDLSMFQQGFRGIVVANAHPSLKALAGPDVYLSPHSFAHGVLDGLQHWLADCC
jgi:sucrose-6F-phosphate phosphohydrolase